MADYPVTVGHELNADVENKIYSKKKVTNHFYFSL